MNIYLDIETLPTEDPEIIEEIAARVTPPGNMTKAETIAKWAKEKKPAIIEELVDRTALGPVTPPHVAFGRVLCVGFAIDDGEVEVALAEKPEDEAEMIAYVGDILLKECAPWRDDPLIIGHNIKEFDWRYLCQRAVILGIDSAFSLSSPFPMFDTMLTWTGHYTRHVSLDMLCRAFRIPGKSETDGCSGADVARMYRAGEIDRIVKYCKHDVERTRSVFKRMTFQEGF